MACLKYHDRDGLTEGYPGEVSFPMIYLSAQPPVLILS